MNCVRCGRPEAPALARRPMPGPAGAEIQEKIEVMVINELRLNFMDPESQKVLSQHMREFLFSGGGPGGVQIGPSSQS